MRYSAIVGTASYLPKKVLTNADLEKIVDTSDEWIVKRTGIRCRHLVEPDEDEPTTRMAVQAAQGALVAANIPVKDIGLIIVATSTPDKAFPSTACLVQAALGWDGCPVFDIQAACAGFNYGLSVADQFIRNGTVDTALVIGSETMSRLVDWKDRTTCILFGDGAGAVVLKANEKPGIIASHLHAAGSYKGLLYSEKKMGKDKIVMQGNEVFKIAVTRLSEVLKETLNASQIRIEDIDWLIPHQANLRIIQSLANNLKLPDEKVLITIDQHGNTSAASIPLALDTGIRAGHIKRGQLLLVESFGAGFTWGSALIRY